MDLIYAAIIGVIILFGGVYVVNTIRDAVKGIDRRTPEQKLLDTTLTDRVTRLGSAFEAMNAFARGEKPKTRF